MHKLENELNLAKKIAVEAGQEILQIYNTEVKVELKDDKSPLTEADKRANTIIVKKLKDDFPHYAILSEESRDDKSRLDNDWCWIVDPLDGTKEFIKKNGEFTVNIALTFQKKVILGVIYAPVLNELFYAAKGIGSYLQKDGKIFKNQVTNNQTDLKLVASRSHMSDKLKQLTEKYKITNIKSIGSSLKGCLVASGEADLYYRFGPTMEWDTAAMQCIVEEAGGYFRQMDDSLMLYNRENSLNDKGFYILNRIENKFDL